MKGSTLVKKATDRLNRHWNLDMAPDADIPANGFILTFFLAVGTYAVYYMAIGFLDRYMGKIPELLLKLDHLMAAVVAVIVAVTLTAAAFRSRSAVEAVKRVAGVLHCPAWYPAALFFLVITVCAVLTDRHQPGTFADNRGCLYDVCVCVFILLPVGMCLGRSGRYIPIRKIFPVFLWGYSLFVLYGFLALMFPDTFGSEGIYMERYRFYLFSNPNTTAMICTAMMIGAVPLFLTEGRTKRILLVLSYIMLYVCLMFTDSRTSIIAVTVSLSAAAVLLAMKWKRPAWKRALAGGSAVVMILLLFLGGQKGFTPLRIAVSDSAVQEISEAAPAVPVEQAGSALPQFSPEQVQRPLLTKDLNERTDIWKSAVEILKTDPHSALHGCSPNEIPKRLMPYLGRQIYTHNQLLEVVMAYGIPALLVFFLWMMMLAWKSLKVGLGVLQDKVPVCVSLMPLVLLELVINNMAEGVLLFYRYPVGQLFFLVAGCVIGTAVTMDKADSRGRAAGMAETKA